MRAGDVCEVIAVELSRLTPNIGKRVRLLDETILPHEWVAEILDPMVDTKGATYPVGTVGMFYSYNLRVSPECSA